MAIALEYFEAIQKVLKLCVASDLKKNYLLKAKHSSTMTLLQFTHASLVTHCFIARLVLVCNNVMYEISNIALSQDHQ